MSSEKLFTIIRDGEWHSLNELASQLQIPTGKLAECAQDLYSKGIVEYQENPQKMKIQPEWKKLLPDENLSTD
jgi:DNA-binding IclR family transcriptional regulator